MGHKINWNRSKGTIVNMWFLLFLSLCMYVDRGLGGDRWWMYSQYNGDIIMMKHKHGFHIAFMKWKKSCIPCYHDVFGAANTGIEPWIGEVTLINHKSVSSDKSGTDDSSVIVTVSFLLSPRWHPLNYGSFYWGYPPRFRLHENMFRHYHFPSNCIDTHICTFHDSPTVVTYAKFRIYYSTKTWHDIIFATGFYYCEKNISAKRVLGHFL